MSEDIDNNLSLEPARTGRNRTDGDWIDLSGTTLASCAISAALAYYIFHKEETLILVALLGTVLGWACGLIASPYNDVETKSMGNISKIASVVIGGYLVLKLDKVADALISSAIENAAKSEEKLYGLAIHISTASVMYITAFIFVYITRSYKLSFSEMAKKAGHVLHKIFQKVNNAAQRGFTWIWERIRISFVKLKNRFAE